MPKEESKSKEETKESPIIPNNKLEISKTQSYPKNKSPTVSQPKERLSEPPKLESKGSKKFD